MRSLLALIVLGRLVVAIPAPQAIDLDGVIAVGPPPLITYATRPTIIRLSPTVLASEAAAAVSTGAIIEPADAPVASGKKKRDITSVSSACATAATQPTGAGAVPAPDSPSAFLGYLPFASTASAAPTPSGYANTFTNLQGESQSYGYLGYTLLSSYDTAACAAQCDTIFACMAVNLAFERAPSVDPQSGCDDPPSTTLIKCVFWGAPLSATTATNTGQYRENFHVVITGSNGYVKNVTTSTTGYTGPVQMGSAAINALYNCNNAYTYMGYMEFSDSIAFDPTRCTAACTAKSNYNLANGIDQTCRFVNAYLLLRNGQVQGQICSFYNETWDARFATNTGYFYQSDTYTIAASVTYSNHSDPGVCKSASLASSIAPITTFIKSTISPISSTNTSPTPIPLTSNLILNGDFYLGYNVNWTTTSASTGAYSVQPSRTDSGPDGNGAVVLSCGSPVGLAGSVYYSSATYAVGSGQNYSLSFAYNYVPGQNNTTEDDAVVLQVQDTSSGFLVDTRSSTAIGGTSTYRVVETSFVAGSSSTNLVFGLVCGSQNQAAVKFDEVVVVAAT